MRLAGNPGKADCGGEAIHGPWHPAVGVVSRRDYRRHGKKRRRRPDPLKGDFPPLKKVSLK